MVDIQQVIDGIRREKMIAILRGLPEDQLLRTAEALYAGGIRFIECTFDHAREDCIEANSRMIAQLAGHFAGRMHVGAGTVLTCEEVDATIAAGGEFIISPNADAEVIRYTREKGAVSIPGALTPTEIVGAWKAGAHFVKVFPAGDLGVSYIKSVRAPLRHIPMLAVGGITPEIIPEYLKAGVSGFGVSGPLLPKGALETGNDQAITERARLFVSAAKG